MSTEGAAATAGSLLRAAREAQGLHIAALAASIKVSPRKLEALEGDRYDELAGRTFTRALAQSVCRALRIDPQPVLELLPAPDTVELDNVTGGLNAPYRERGSREDQGLAATAQRSLLWAGIGLLIAALVTYLVPGSWLRSAGDPPALAASAAAPGAAPGPVASAPAGAAMSSGAASAASPGSASAAPNASDAAVATSAPGTGAAPPAIAASGPAAALTLNRDAPASPTLPAEGPLRLSATSAAWVEVRDAGGNVVFSRTLQPGESAGVGGATPLRLVIGNAAAVQVSFRGQPVDLAPSTRVNVARLELN
jgi:cytoskeleton protein RodZ